MNSELKPKIRFKGFTDDWEQRKLKDIGEILTGSTPSTSHEEYYSSDGMLWVIPTDINSNIIKTTARRLSIKGEKVARIVPKNTILVTCIASIGKNALVLEKSSFNQQINSLTPFDKYNPYFLLTDSVLWSNTMKQQGAAGMMQIVNKNEFSEIETNIPSEEEQNKIGNLYKQIDNLITLHQRKCDKLVELKKSLLEKMFPQNNSVIPEIRFKGFTDDWEQRKLEDFGSFTGGTSIESEFEENGKYKVISIGSYSETSKYNDQGIRCRLSEKTINKILNKDDLTMILNDKTSSGNIIGRVLIIDKSGEYVYNQRTERIEPNIQKYYPQFLYHMLNAPNIRKKIIKQSQGNTQIFVNWTGIQKLEYLVPKMDEQINLAKLIGNLDNLITLHQRKHDKLNKIKQSLLNDMFV